MSGASVATTPEALPEIQVAGSGATETRTSANRPLPRMGLVETLPPLSCGVARSSLWPHVRTDLATLPATRLRRGDRGVVRDLGRRGARGARVLAPASRATSLVSRSGTGRAREMVARWQRRVVRAELERWRLRGLTRFLLPVIDRCGPRRGIPARRVARLMLFAVRATRVGRLLAVVAAAAALSAAAAVAFVAVAELL
jgi:hypothetical protein